MSFETLKVAALRDYLQVRGVSCYLYNKEHLVRLCNLAVELNLDVIGKKDEVIHSEDRKNIKIDDQDFVIKPAGKLTGDLWSSNLRDLPSLESCNIMIYLMKECGWEDDRLKHCKADNGYKLHLANHVQDVEMAVIQGLPYIYMRCACVPETRQNDPPYQTWVCVGTNGTVHAGGCTCVAGNGTCKHVVAFLFSVGSFLERHKDRHSQSCTDIECTWDKPRKSSEPMEIDKIDISHDQGARVRKEPISSHYIPVPNDQLTFKKVEEELVNLFSNHKPDSLLLLTLDTPSHESLSSENIVPITMQEAIGNLPPNVDIETHLKNVFIGSLIQEIEQVTRGQSENVEWFEHRRGRLTASIFPSVMNFKFNDAPQNYILKLVMNMGNNYRTPSLNFGKEHEPIACQRYYAQSKTTHKSLKVETCGLFIDKEFPYMGASPDGKVSCKCCGNGILEIKCSFTYQNDTPETACNDDHYYVYMNKDGTVRLKPSSSWYIQIQGQMGVCNVEYCDFVFYTRKGIIIDRIFFNKHVYDNIVKKCKKFFETYVIKALRNGK